MSAEDKERPLVSVIMATYNTPCEWLEQSIRSILDQSYSLFEFIIINDHSETDLSQIKRSVHDSRIIWIDNEKNIGLTRSLNKALQYAKGEYVVRMDADDISTTDRIMTQVIYMQNHPEVIVCGAYRESFGAESQLEAWNIPKSREEQQIQLFFFNCGITHPTAMFRMNMLKKYKIRYNEKYEKAQDYGIWVQCTRYAPMAVIPKVLLKYRKSDKQVTSNKSSVRYYDGLVRTDQLEALQINASDDEQKMHLSFCRGETFPDAQNLNNWINRLKSANEKTGYFEQYMFRKSLERRWYQYCCCEYILRRNKQYQHYYFTAITPRNVILDIEIKAKQAIASVLRTCRNLKSK